MKRKPFAFIQMLKAKLSPANLGPCISSGTDNFALGNLCCSRTGLSVN